MKLWLWRNWVSGANPISKPCSNPVHNVIPDPSKLSISPRVLRGQWCSGVPSWLVWVLWGTERWRDPNQSSFLPLQINAPHCFSDCLWGTSTCLRFFDLRHQSRSELIIRTGVHSPSLGSPSWHLQSPCLHLPWTVLDTSDLSLS